MQSVYDVIRRPVISEKSTALAEVGGRYVFEVAVHSRKEEIKDAVQNLFNVKVRSVNTMIVHGKSKKTKTNAYKRPNWKKAVVTLAEGEKIDFFQTK